jgi:hypothetical protein
MSFDGPLIAGRYRLGPRLGHGSQGEIVGTFGYMAPEQLHGQAVPATDIYALGATIVALASGVEPEDVPRKGLKMDLDRHLPGLDPAFRQALLAMTDPDPEQRPQRARDVVALLAKARPAKKPSEAKALVRQDDKAVAPRRMFGDIQEPLGTLLRISVLGFGFGGWLGMAGIRVSLMITIYLIAMFGFPKRRRVLAVGHELDAMLAEGQGGFTDMMKGAMARR